MKTILSILLAVCIMGCMSTQKATNYLEKKGKLAEVCATRYPVQDSKIIIKEHVTTDTVLGTSYIMIDTCDGKVVQKPCPPTKTITNTIVRDTTIYKRDRAYEAVLLNELQAYNKQIKALDSMNNKLSRESIAYKKKANDWQWKAIFTWVLVGVLGLFLISKSLKLF
jgi:hypothetical protein